MVRSAGGRLNLYCSCTKWEALINACILLPAVQHSHIHPTAPQHLQPESTLPLQPCPLPIHLYFGLELTSFKDEYPTPHPTPPHIHTQMYANPPPHPSSPLLITCTV